MDLIPMPSSHPAIPDLSKANPPSWDQVVSQFTLFATFKGLKPNFNRALPSNEALDDRVA